MNIDVACLLRDALTESGCDSQKLDNFDNHSTIVLEFDGHPDIFVTQLDDDIWLWTRLVEDNGLTLSQFSSPLLEKLMQGCQFAASGQLHLATNEGFIELKGLVHRRYLQSATQFAAALDEFFSLSEDFFGIYQ